MKVTKGVLQLQALVALLVGKGKITTFNVSVVAWATKRLTTLDFQRIELELLKFPTSRCIVTSTWYTILPLRSSVKKTLAHPICASRSLPAVLSANRCTPNVSFREHVKKS
jgi:hypothetical protein